MKKTDFKERLAHLKKELNKARLVGVSKYTDVEEMKLAYEAGLRDFGENKVQDLEMKAASFLQDHLDSVRWHFIGHLQTNKVKDLLKIPHLDAIHSVDSLKLVHEIVKRIDCFKGKELKIFFQVNTSHEEEKSGFLSMEELEEAIDFLLSHSNSKLKLWGLMTMGSIREDNFEEAAHKSFSELGRIKEKLLLKYKSLSSLKLSMGMSQDYKIAILNGTDYVRIGSALFK